MVDRSEDADEAKKPLAGLESVTSNRVKSSKADEGLDDNSGGFAERYSDGGDFLEAKFNMSLAVGCRLI
jgi:hypothetical protein